MPVFILNKRYWWQLSFLRAIWHINAERERQHLPSFFFFFFQCKNETRNIRPKQFHIDKSWECPKIIFQ